MWPDLGAIRDGIIFNILNMVGSIFWTLDRIMMMLAAVLHWFRVLLVGGGGQDNLLGIMMTQLLQGNELLKQLVYLGIMLAFTVLAFTLIARPLIGRFQAVEFNKVILWFFIAVIIFSAGPGMVSGLESTRLGLQEQAHLIASTIQYQNEVNRYNNQVVPNTVGDFWLPGQTPGHVPHLFGNSVGSNCPAGCNGLDAAAAFLGAEEGDITGARADAQNTGGYPRALYDRYFTWRDGNEEERGASVRNAKDGVMRLLEGTLPAFFSIIEAVIFLLFGIAAMVLFISLPVAIPFAFFSLTEIIAASVLRAYLFLVIRTFVVATMLAFLVQMLIIFAERGTALVFIAIAALTMLLSFQFVGMAASTVTGALNVIGSAVGSATGVSVRQTDPFAAAGRVAGMAALAGAAVATGGGALVGAATLLHRQGGLRGGGLGAVGSAALHAARVRAGAAVGRTPLAGVQRGYSAVQNYHQMAREHAYQLETARALRLDRDADEAAAILMEQKSVSPHRREWAVRKVSEWTSTEESRQKYRQEMRTAGLGRLGWRGYSRPWKSLPPSDGIGSNKPGPGSTVSAATGRGDAQPGAHANETAHPGGPSSPASAEWNGATRGANTSTESRQDLRGAVGAPDQSAAPTASDASKRIQAVSVKRVSSTSNSPLVDAGHTQGEPYVATMLKFKAHDLSVRSMADDAVLVENRAVALVDGYLVVYSGARSEDDPRLGRYDLVPVTTDIFDLLQKGKHVQKSRKRPGFLVAWEPATWEAANGEGAVGSSGLTPGLTLWSGADDRARRQVLSDVRDLADQVGRGLPLTANTLRGKLSHLSTDDRQRFASMLQEGVVSPGGMLRVLEAARDVAESASTIDGMEGADDPQAVLNSFVGPNGYLDLGSPGVASVLSMAASRGGPIRMQPPGSQDAPGQPDQGIPASDMALMISAGLGLKRNVSWPQVKGAIVAASLSDEADPVQAVSEELGATSLRTSTAPVKRFVETARYAGLSATDLSTTLDVATSSHDVSEVIAAIPEKDGTRRHTRWRAAGVPQNMLQPLDRVRSNALLHVSRLSTPDTPDHKTHERAQEVLGTLLAEGMTISDELYSVPIETYSAHPFTADAVSMPNTLASELPPVATPAAPSAIPGAIAFTPGNALADDVHGNTAGDEPHGGAGSATNLTPVLELRGKGKRAPDALSPTRGTASKLDNSEGQGDVRSVIHNPRLGFYRAGSWIAEGSDYTQEPEDGDETN